MSGTRSRIGYLDEVRGLVIALMALDHVRIYFTGARFDPADVSQTTPDLFAIRWITHLCAPGFFFLAGVSISMLQRKSPSRVSAVLWTAGRGAWLMLLEIAVFGLAWSFNPGWHWLGVIWGLGAAMVVMAVLMLLPCRISLFLGLAGVLLHSELWPVVMRYIPFDDVLLYSEGVVNLPVLGATPVIYPLIPWTAVMVLGYGSADWLLSEGVHRRTSLAAASVALLLGFAACRWFALGADPREVAFAGSTLAEKSMSFLNVEKYPPSSQYLLVTLGLLGSITAFLRSRSPGWKILSWLAVFGSVPFLFYLLHLFLIHGLALAVAWLAGWPLDYLFWKGTGPNLVPPHGYGVGTAGVIFWWVVLLTALYWPCRWYRTRKLASRSPWLRLI